MEWESKTKVCQLGNASRNGESEKSDFQGFVLLQLPNFDIQAWDMFCNLVDIIPDEMQKEIDFWVSVWRYLKAVDCNNEKLGFRSGMRIAMLQTICEEELKLA
jgi:hypothetical protein